MQEILPPERPLRERHDGWTKARQEQFLAALKAEGSVDAACAAVGMSTTSAYKVKQRFGAFRRAWEAALAEAKARIEKEVMRRAVEGWDDPVFQGGKQVGVRRKYSDSLLRMVSLRESAAAAKARQEEVPVVAVAPRLSVEEIERVLLQRLDSLARQRDRRLAIEAMATRQAAADEADRLRDAGQCP